MKLTYVTTACTNEIARIVNNVSVITSAVSLLLSTLWVMAMQVISNIRANKRFLSRSASTSFCSLLKIIFCVFITPYFFFLKIFVYLKISQVKQVLRCFSRFCDLEFVPCLKLSQLLHLTELKWSTTTTYVHRISQEDFFFYCLFFFPSFLQFPGLSQRLPSS